MQNRMQVPQHLGPSRPRERTAPTAAPCTSGISASAISFTPKTWQGPKALLVWATILRLNSNTINAGTRAIRPSSLSLSQRKPRLESPSPLPITGPWKSISSAEAPAQAAPHCGAQGKVSLHPRSSWQLLVPEVFSARSDHKPWPTQQLGTYLSGCPQDGCVLLQCGHLAGASLSVL